MTGKAGVGRAFQESMTLWGRGINPHIIKGKKELENAARGAGAFCGCSEQGESTPTSRESPG